MVLKRKRYRSKRVSIITITDPTPNYGNRLQNYAVVSVLNTFGLHVVTLNTQRQTSLIKWRLKAIINALSGYHLSKNQATFIKGICFGKFANKYLNPSNELLEGKLKSNKYDYYVLGSDQVWNPAWYTPLKKEAFLLTFAGPEQKVCFSPSFGIEELPSEWKEWFKANLQTFPHLSVRENAGKKIINNLIGRDAEVLIDPTLMLDKADWLKIAKKPKKVDFSKRYILTCFLGDRTTRIENDLKKYAEENNLIIFNLLDRTQPDLFKSGPSEFIFLISRAALVMTDSFHACVFSFIFQKPFLLYARQGKENNMLSRMDTLFNTFDLRRKYVDSGINNDLFECDYSKGYKQLEIERKKAIKFLKESLHLE